MGSPSTTKTKVHELALSELVSDVKRFAENSISKTTKHEYKKRIDEFRRWSEKKKLSLNFPITPEVAALYLTDRSKTLKASSIRVIASALEFANKLAGGHSITSNNHVKLVLAGIFREKGLRQEQKKPLLTYHIRELAEELERCKSHEVEKTKASRDKALLLLGFAGAFRRSELCALDLSDFAWSQEGLVIDIRKSKTDQLSRGRKIGICVGKNPLTCPVKALNEWLRISGISSGPIFRPLTKNSGVRNRRLSPRSVALILKSRFREIGKCPKDFAGHSLRSGCVTAAIQGGADPLDVQKHTGHSNFDMLRRYIREATVFKRNPTDKLGL